MKKAIILIITSGLISACVRTPGFPSRHISSITSLEEIEVNRDTQHLLIRGLDTSNPILLFLHGGPGMPMMYMSHTFQKELEKQFIVVQWDQRSSGKSFKEDMDPALINVRQYLDDANVIIEYMMKMFGKEKVFLAGHSWGSYLGTLLIKENPKLFHAYIGIGQVVDDSIALIEQEKFLKSEALERDDKKAQDELNEYGVNIFEKYLFKYGGELKNSTSYWPFIKAGLGSAEYAFKDIMNVGKGSNFCSRYMKNNVSKGSLLSEGITSFDIPVFYFTGTYDMTTPYVLIQDYFKSVQAPYKEIIWFKNSAHFPFFEEPDLFYQSMIEVKNKVLPE